ncbi:membrane protein [Massilia sp. WF1]|uniref:FtsH protease activity modulator HflK n=1 Tax=unclassified Massilia TaxID=2609279 RepID=UPI00064A3973|nr:MULTISPECIES: FtsH protease activity modulator HflK [unclassified Massilia]ALK98201.1 HflK protein [Massilia sp. WG5]KLU37225.1 membrane protein [Massilia sp. WF1]
MSLHDPRWGHKPEDPKAQQGKGSGNDGPPDLDQLWRDFNQRLNRLFGKRGDGGGYRPDARGVGVTASVVGAILFLIWLASGAFIVPEGQVGLVTTFGQLSHKTGAGFNWRWPAPFQAHETVNVSQVQTAEIGYRANVRNKQPNEALMLTADENIVDVQFSVQYKIKDPVAWVFNNREQVETVRDAAETVVRELVGRAKMDALLAENRDQLAGEAQGMIQKMVDSYKLGAAVTGVTVQSLAAPEQIAGAFEETVKAQEERARARSEAQAYADDIIPQAKGKAERQKQDAEAYRATVVNTAEGNAARFNQVVAEYAKAPAVTRDRMYLDTMQQIFSSTSKVMIDAKTSNQIYLPLDRMLNQSLANEAAIGSRSGPVMPAPQGPQAGQPQNQPQQNQSANPQQNQQNQPQAQAAPAPDQHPQPESVRKVDPRSRDSSRERETR